MRRRAPLPVPRGLGRDALVFRPGQDVRRVAWAICERAWKGRGVVVFRWPCGTVVVAPRKSVAEARLLGKHADLHLATYALDAHRRGPQMVDVVGDLNWVGAAA